MGAPPCTPAAWAETPTHAAPERVIQLCALPQSGAVSKPTLTFSHSTNTVPENVDGSEGR